MTDQTVLFRLDADASGAITGFRITREELDKLRAANDGVKRSTDKAATGLDKQGRAAKRSGRQMDLAARGANRLKAAVAGIFAIATVRQAILYADTIKNIDARLMIATDSTKEFKRAQSELFEIAQRTYSSLESTVELYARLELSLKSSTTTQEEILTVTEALNKAYQAGGATAQEATSSVIQLSQGLAAGALRGEEFRSVMEGAPRVIDALTASLGVSRGALREMANDGKLSTEIIVQALLEQADEIDADFQNIELTVGRAFTNMRNEALKYVGEMDDATDASKTFAEAVQLVGENIGTVLNVALASTAVGLLALVPAFARAATSARLFLAGLGPAGIAAIAIGGITLALLEYIDATDDAEQATRRYTRSLNDLSTAEGLKGVITDARDEIALLTQDAQNLRDELNDLEDPYSSSNASETMFGGAVPTPADLARIAELKAELAELDAVIASRTGTIEKATEELGKLGEADAAAIKSAKELAAAQALEAEQLAALTDAQKIYRSAIEEGGTQQERISLLMSDYAATLAEVEEGLKGQPDAIAKVARVREILGRALKANIEEIENETDAIMQFKDALEEVNRAVVDTTEEGFLQLELMLETLALQFGEDSAIVLEFAEAIRQARLEVEGLNEASANTGADLSAFGKGQNSFYDVLGNAVGAAIEGGFSDGADVIKDAFRTNPGGSIAFAAGAANQFINLNRAYNAPDEFGNNPYGGSADGTIRALADTILPIVAMMGPWGAAIAGVITLVDNITGGGLFGTPFKTTESRRIFDIDAAGGGGGSEYDQKRKKSFFRGTARQTVNQELSADEQRAASELYDAAYGALFGAMEALGVTAADFVSGSFKETFDKDGNLVSSVSTIMGEAFEETFEEFGKRLIAENLIAAVAAAVGDVEVTRLVDATPRLPDSRGDYGAGRAFGGNRPLQEVTEMVNEAQAIAERWRGSAEILLEGAQLLLLAQGAIQDGSGIFESLTDSVNIVEELANAGESMVETFTRIKTSIETVEGALEIMGVSLDLSRDAFVRYSEAFTDAAGGVARAGQLWSNYFSVFFEADELLEAQLRVARGSAADELADVGLGADTSKAQFKAVFEDILPTLSADMLVEWLEAGEALGVVLSLEEQLAEVRGDAVGDLIEAYRSASDAIDDLLGSTITSLRREMLSDDELYGEFRSEALGKAGQISSAGSREEVLALVAEIEALTRDARGVAGDTRFNPELIEFLQQVGEGAGIRLDELKADELADLELRVSEVASREQFATGAQTFASSVEDFGAIVEGGGIVVGAEGGSIPLQDQIVAGIREGFDPEQMAAAMESLNQTVQIFAEITQFHAANPPTLKISQPTGGDNLGLT